MEARIRHREQGRDPSWYLGAAAYLVETMERSDIADYVIETANRPVSEVAQDILHMVGWLP